MQIHCEKVWRFQILGCCVAAAAAEKQHGNEIKTLSYKKLHSNSLPWSCETPLFLKNA